MTGVGFFTKIIVEGDVARPVGRPTFKLGNVHGQADNVRHGLGFLLYVTDGAISMLEGYTYDDPWPDDLQNLRLHSTAISRDICGD